MGSFSKNIFFMLILFVLLSITSCCETDAFLLHKVHVNITNEIGPGIDLKLHCKSKKDDLHQQVLVYEDYFDFRFRPNFWGTTQYFCSFAWKDVLRRFDIFIFTRDFKKCPGYNCEWIIKEGGPCRFNGVTKKFDICFVWKGG